MKKLVILFLLISIVTIGYGKNIFEYTDIIGDDNGAGNITYPTDEVFVKGAFDIQKFKIYEDGDEYSFEFEVGTNFKNEWKNKNGWDVQMFDVYINLGKGKNKMALAGRNTKLHEGWDIALIVAPEENKKFLEREIIPKNDFVADDVTEGEDLINDIKLPTSIFIDSNKLTAKIKKTEFANLNNIKFIQVFVTGAEGFPSSEESYIRNVNEFPTKWRFGGGSDYFGDSNVIDILGDNKNLDKFVSTEDETIYPVVNMIKVGK
ncbi:MAG: hypothetical protein GX287_03985 [Fusobacteria bacterium]|nr:hypothetical protein [Fusobacteriota bacterium]